MTQKQQAKKILMDFGLLEFLNDNCGKAHVIGSYVTDLMVANDLDVDIENQNMSQQKLYEVTGFVTKTFSPVWYEAKQVTDDSGNVEWFCGFEFVLDNQVWNVDLWFLNEYKISRAENETKRLSEKIAQDPSLAESIVNIKKGLIERNLYSHDNYTSQDVYDAVLLRNVRDIDEFLFRCAKHGTISRYAKVCFEERGCEYTYKCDNPEIEVGDVVDAPTCNYAYHSPALVTKIEYLGDYQLTVDKRKVLLLEKIIDKQDSEFLFDRLGFMKSKIDPNLTAEWNFEEENDYCKFYRCSYGGQIAYMQDGVLEFWFGDITSADCFTDYTITSEENFDVKIQFVQTILSQLYYKKINEEEFYKLLDRMTGAIRYNK